MRVYSSADESLPPYFTLNKAGLLNWRHAEVEGFGAEHVQLDDLPIQFGYAKDHLWMLIHAESRRVQPFHIGKQLKLVRTGPDNEARAITSQAIQKSLSLRHVKVHPQWLIWFH